MLPPSKTRIVLILFLLTGVGTLVYLNKTGYWSAESKAKRELVRQDIPINARQVKLSTRKSDLTTLSLLATAGVDFNGANATDKNGDSPLHYSVKQQDWKTVEFLLNAQTNPDTLDAQSRTVTSLIMESGNIMLAKKLLQGGALVDFKHTSGEPALIQNIRDKNIGNVLTLINEGVDVNTTSMNGETALFAALKDGLYEPATALIAAGADVNGKTPSGVNMLTHICQSLPETPFKKSDTTAIMRQLIDSGADLNATGNGGWRPLQWCVKYRHLDGINHILAKDQNVEETLWIALQNEDDYTASLLLQKGANANEIGAEGRTPLMTMIRDNRSSMITELLNYGVDSEEIGNEGQSALITAITMKNTDSALALLTHPSNPAGHSNILATPVTDAFSELYGENGKFDWYCSNAPGFTTLMVAVVMDDILVAEQLIKNGANRTQGTKNRYPVYPIQMAAERKNIQMQQLLLGVSYKDEDQVRRFVIDLSEQKVRYYKNGKIMRTSSVSTGRYGFRTKTGNYVITDRKRDKRSNIYDDALMPYFQRFSCSAIGFHEGNTYSRYASHGCVRLPMSTAKYFWSQAKVGDRVDIVK